MHAAQFGPATATIPQKRSHYLTGVAGVGLAMVPFALVPVVLAGFDSALMFANSSGTIFFTLSSAR